MTINFTSSASVISNRNHDERVLFSKELSLFYEINSN